MSEHILFWQRATKYEIRRIYFYESNHHSTNGNIKIQNILNKTTTTTKHSKERPKQTEKSKKKTTTKQTK